MVSFRGFPPPQTGFRLPNPNQLPLPTQQFNPGVGFQQSPTLQPIQLGPTGQPILPQQPQFGPAPTAGGGGGALPQPIGKDPVTGQPIFGEGVQRTAGPAPGTSGFESRSGNIPLPSSPDFFPPGGFQVQQPSSAFGLPTLVNPGATPLPGGGGGVPQFSQPQFGAQPQFPGMSAFNQPQFPTGGFAGGVLQPGQQFNQQAAQQPATPINFETGQNFPVDPNTGVVGTPPTGLIGAEEALLQGAGGAVGALQGAGAQAREDLLTGAARAQIPLQGAAAGIGAATQTGLGLIEQGIDPLTGFSTGGQQAFDLQSALLGAQGPEAQAAAFEQFQQSPGQQFLQEEQERATIRNAAAIGGLGGGNVRQELQRRALGRAEQAFDTRISQLGGLAGQGLQAAGQVGQLQAVGADLAQRGAVAQGNVAALASGIESDLGINLAQLEQSTGINVGQILENLGSGQAEVRDAAGVRLANAIQTASGQLADLQAGQGAGIADIGAGQIANIGNLLIESGAFEAQLQQSLSTLLANLAVGEGTNQAQIASNVGNIEASGILGQTQLIGDSLTDLSRLIGRREPERPASVTTAPPGVFP